MQVIGRPVTEVFSFFLDPRNLETITPAFLHFSILPPVPDRVRAGSIVDYRLRLYGVPFRWRTVIESVILDQQFTDRQIRGPYRL